MKLFVPEKIFYEPAVEGYPLGRELLERFGDVPMEPIANHNNIEALRTQPNTAFPQLKRYLILGTRKTHKYTDNHKVSDYLVPFTSSGCTAMCLYCYLVCNYNKCAYLRLFVNREEMLEKMMKRAAAGEGEETVFEIGSNSDMVLENTLTGNLAWTIQRFTEQPRGKLTFPTKFHMVDDILNLNHQGRVIPRVSLNPREIIAKFELGTSRLPDRIEAVNRMCEAGYPVGILLAPVIFVPDWREQYGGLLEAMAEGLSPKAKRSVFFEVIFMTYSYIHDRINTEAFPGADAIYDPALMTGRGRGKYWYKAGLREEGEVFFRERLGRMFPGNALLYVV